MSVSGLTKLHCRTPASSVRQGQEEVSAAGKPARRRVRPGLTECAVPIHGVKSLTECRIRPSRESPITGWRGATRFKHRPCVIGCRLSQCEAAEFAAGTSLRRLHAYLHRVCHTRFGQNSMTWLIRTTLPSGQHRLGRDAFTLTGSPDQRPARGLYQHWVVARYGGSTCHMDYSDPSLSLSNLPHGFLRSLSLSLSLSQTGAGRKAQPVMSGLVITDRLESVETEVAGSSPGRSGGPGEFSSPWPVSFVSWLLFG